MFFDRSRYRRKRTSTTISKQFHRLEDRRLLAAIVLNDAGQLYIAGGSGDNTGSLSMPNSTTYRATVDAVTQDYAISSVNEIYFLGYGGNDTFTNHTAALVTAYGHAGNDTLRGGSGSDVLIGGSGSDTIHGNDGDDRLIGANGNDVIYGGDGNDRIFGSAGANTLNGNDGDDVMYGSDDGDDIMSGGEGLDWIFGLGGDDELRAGNGGTVEAGELVMGHGGNDEFFGGTGLNIFWGGEGDDVMVGGSGINRMHGQNGNDSLTGGSAADLLKGNNGNDTIKGLGGHDTIDAGPGTDVVEFTNSYASATVTASASGQTATVMGSNGSDRIAGSEWLDFSDRRITSNQATLAAVESASLELLNNYRSSSSRAIFSTPSDLTTFAENWSRTMARNGTLSHSSQSSRNALRIDGRTTIGENVIQIQDNGQSIESVANVMHRAWVDSSGHRANMLNNNFLEAGIGIFKSGGFWWGTHVFAG